MQLEPLFSIKHIVHSALMSAFTLTNPLISLSMETICFWENFLESVGSKDDEEEWHITVIEMGIRVEFKLP